VSIQTVAPEGGTITGFTGRSLRASWITSQNVSGLELQVIVYDGMGNIVADYYGTEITVVPQSGSYQINLEGSQSKTPKDGAYTYALCDRTNNLVLFLGKLFVYSVPELPEH